MSWHYSQALVGAFSERNCLDSEQCAQLSSSRSALKTLIDDKRKGIFNPSQYGTTCEPSMVARGVGKWILSLPDSPASLSVLQESVRERWTKEICGLTPVASYEKSDPHSAYWKTSQGSLIPDISIQSLKTFTKAGMMLDGKLYRRQKWERRISETACGFYVPTPSRSDGERGPGKEFIPNSKRQSDRTLVTFAKKGQKWLTPRAKETAENPETFLRRVADRTDRCRGSLSAQVMWPTPTGQEVEHPEAELTETNRRKTKDGKNSHSLNLADKVKLWPTPRAGNPGSRPNGKGGKILAEEVKKTWPTPAKRDYKGANGEEHMKKGGRSHMGQLPNAVKYDGGTKTPQTWPTPKASDGIMGLPRTTGRPPYKAQHLATRIAYPTPRQFMYKDSQTDSGKGNLGEVIQNNQTGQLNPDWVEWLMGWPIGWTGLKPLETDKFQQWLKLHGKL